MFPAGHDFRTPIVSGGTIRDTPPAIQPDSSQKLFIRRLAYAAVGILAIALIGGLAVGAISVLKGQQSKEPTIAEVTADLLVDRPQGDPDAAAARRAVESIRASGRAEDRAAFSSFAAGAQQHALNILEKLAADLERGGDKAAAAEAYTRVGAVALLIDEGRRLAARRKAFALAPESLLAFQGLFFDIFRLRGFNASAAFAAWSA